MDFPPKVIAAITSMEEAGEALSLGADILEVRVDLVKTPYYRLVKNIRSDLKCPLVITVRPDWEGGKFHGADDDRLAIFKELVEFADYVDVELRAKNLDELIETVKGSDALPIVSYHDFEATPSNNVMLGIISQAVEKGGIAKLAVMPRSLEDVLRLYAVTLHSRRPVCTIAMGDLGSHSRLISPIYGSLFTYGYVRKPVAPGQVRVDKLKEGLGILGLR